MRRPVAGLRAAVAARRGRRRRGGGPRGDHGRAHRDGHHARAQRGPRARPDRPLSVHEVVRDLGVRRPATVSVVVASDPDPEVLAAAMDAGARGVLTYPLSFDAVQQRVQNALEWSRQMEAMLDATRAGGTSARGRATVVVMTGSKGGVGTTALLTHLAWDLRRRTPDLKVAVVDADLEKGTSRATSRGVPDLDRGPGQGRRGSLPRTVADAMFEHESGLHLLLPPEDVREVEFVTPPRSARSSISCVSSTTWSSWTPGRT
ncbi:hypothetical protein NKG05_16715 [Oerskovia sp. M15]